MKQPESMIKSGFMHVFPLPKRRVVSKTHEVSNNKNIEEIKIALEAY